MSDVTRPDADPARVARFFVDLMLTLAEGGIVGAESAEAIGALWCDDSGRIPPRFLQLDAATVVRGLGEVAAALAGELVATRRAAGHVASEAEVWRALGHGQLAADTGELDESSTGSVDAT